MRCIIRLLDAGEDPRNDGVLGPDLVRAGVAGTGHSPMPVEKYLREQLRKKRAIRASARRREGCVSCFAYSGSSTIVAHG